MKTQTTPFANGFSRRSFIGNCAVLGGGLTLLATLPKTAFAAPASGKLRVGVVGSGGRGTGAAWDCLRADPDVEIVAVGDVFEHRVNGAKADLSKDPRNTNIKTFVGFDNYKGVIDSGIDIVILATPPGFRPIHFKYAVEKGVNVFMEKPVATDAAGINTVIAAGKLAKQKGLAVVAGTQRRHQQVYLRSYELVREGIIGDIIGGQVYWNGGGIWYRRPEPQWTAIENQCNNWYHHNWICGDQIVEQHLHNLDVANWFVGARPEYVYASGGRQNRTDPGDIYDHIASDIVYPGDIHVFSSGWHIPGGDDKVDEKFVGTKGIIFPGSGVIRDHKGNNLVDPKTLRGGRNPYEQEHVDLIASIRSGNPLNETQQVAESTFLAILGRESAYSGKRAHWDKVLASDFSIVPNRGDVTRDTPAPEINVPIPGKYKLPQA